MDIMAIWTILQKYLPLLGQVIAVCAAIAAVTPTKSDDRLVQFILDIVNKFGLNVGKAVNKDA